MYLSAAAASEDLVGAPQFQALCKNISFTGQSTVKIKEETQLGMGRGEAHV